MVEMCAIAIETEIANQVWTTMSSPGYGHPASVALARGHGPCRHCLKPFRVGDERRTLFTYNPFRGEAMIPLPGPVFIHTEECVRFSREDGYPPELSPYPVVLDGYDREQQVVMQRKAAPGEQEAALVAMLADTSVSFVIVRDLKAGCFDFRVERKEGVA